MLAKADEVFLSAKRDYSSALIGNQSLTGKALPRDQRIMRKEVLEIVTGSEKIFKSVINQEPEEDEQNDVDQEPKLEYADDADTTKPSVTNEEEPAGCSRVKVEDGDGRNIDLNEPLIVPKSESQEQVMVDQQLLQPAELYPCLSRSPGMSPDDEGDVESCPENSSGGSGIPGDNSD